jgi:predicted dehydrogenase
LFLKALTTHAVSREQLDAASIGLPNNAKVESIRAAAKKGLHILHDDGRCLRR